MMKGTGLEVPPPGAGVTTSTSAVPTVTRSGAGMTAVNRLVLVNAVVSGAKAVWPGPFHSTTDLALTWAKPLPLTVRVRAGLLLGALVGEMVMICGTGKSNA